MGEQKENGNDEIKDQINIDLITQKIIFSNQRLDEKKENKSSDDDKWYCLGIGNIKNIWYPFDRFINQRISENFEKKQESFKLEEGGPSLNIRFEPDSFKVKVPFGTAINVNGDNNEEEELLIIKYKFDFFGFIN